MEQLKSKIGQRMRALSRLPLLPRRDALKGLGVLAVSGTALGASACADKQSDTTAGATAAGTPASAAPNPSPAASNSAAAMPAKAASGTTSMTAGAAGRTATGSGAGASAANGGASSLTPPASAGGSPAVAGSSAGSSAGSGAAGAARGAAGAGVAGASGAAGSQGIEALACIMSPAMTDGPFFVDEKLNRSDLVMGESDEAIAKALPLELTLGVYAVSGMTCTPASGLQVDIWHANANGVYSDVRSGAVQSLDTQGKKYLRGFQVTDEAGLVKFSTIYPGWYPSRTIHIHVKVRMPMGGNRAYDFTSQVFFDEAVSTEILAQSPYNKTMGTRMIFNDDDHIYNGTASNGQKPPAGKTAPGAQMTAALTKTANGYAAVLKLGIKV